jgi:hypothetical protein
VSTILNQHKFNLFYAIVALVAFVVVIIRSYVVPLSHDEAATFFFFIQSGNYMPFYSQVDANNHVLNSFLGNICFHVFGSSPFVLRLPNLIGLVAIIIATYSISKHLIQLGSKVFLTTALLFSFHWLTFFSACRGYGLSMALLILGISYLLNYISNTNQQTFFYKAIIAFQLAISANLILIIIVLLLSGILFLSQLSHKHFFKSKSIMVWLIHFGLIYYWLRFSFFLQDNGALYYGEGESYWKTTFVTLIQLLVGFSDAWFKWSLISFFLFTILICLYLNRKEIFQLKKQIQNPPKSLLFLIILGILCLAFYVMHKVLGVNFPEDITGLFFYVFFVLFVSFTFDKISVKWNSIILYLTSALFFIHFLYYLNFRKHSLYTYETIPEHFYKTLLAEQKKSKERITIGGHRVRELFYGYLNYREDGYLNPADPVELMQMNCDYYLGTIAEEKYYSKYYEVINAEPDWGFTLLKRKQKIQKKQFIQITNFKINTPDNEFLDVYHKIDTVFNETTPLQAQINFSVERISIPCNTWIVFAINDSLDKGYYFKRYPLQWSGYNLNGKTFDYTINMGNLPPKAKNIAFFFWNINKQPISIKVNALKLYQLEGDGVNYEAPDIK